MTSFRLLASAYWPSVSSEKAPSSFHSALRQGSYRVLAPWTGACLHFLSLYFCRGHFKEYCPKDAEDATGARMHGIATAQEGTGWSPTPAPLNHISLLDALVTNCWSLTHWYAENVHQSMLSWCVQFSPPRVLWNACTAKLLEPDSLVH